MLEAKGLHKVYNHRKERLEVLGGINLKVQKGEFVSILGPSGAGKTTLIHALGGLDRPTKGEVFIDGKQIYALSDKELSGLRNIKIGFVFQFYHLLSEFNVLENVLLPGLINRVNRAELSLRAEKILGIVGLENRIKYFPSQLSGGQQQRVAIARALINQPELLFCDEPTGNLDSATGTEIMELIKQLTQKCQMTAVLVTHNQQIAALSDKIYYLRDGQILQEETR